MATQFRNANLLPLPCLLNCFWAFAYSMFDLPLLTANSSRTMVFTHRERRSLLFLRLYMHS